MVLVLFDGDCHFCNFWVKFLIPRDRNRKFKFAPLSLVPELPQNSIVVLHDGKFLDRSEAVFKILETLGWPEWTLEILRKIPKPVRDLGYDFIANRRYLISKIMNSQSGDNCPIPTPLERQKFFYRREDLSPILPSRLNLETNP